MQLKSDTFETTLGSIIAIADDEFLYLLEFFDRKNIDKEIEDLQSLFGVGIVPGKPEPIMHIKQEIQDYFLGKLQQFETPIKFVGTAFQKAVWQELVNISYGQTVCYSQQAQAIGKPHAYRAVANANGKNQLAIIIPCHRVTKSNGELGGYGAGVARKQWLIEHEKKHV